MGEGAFSSFDISASGMAAERMRMNVIAHNIANADARDENGGPYKRQIVLFEEVLADTQRRLNGLRGETGAGVRVSGIERDPKRRIVYAPDHPHADENGNVELSNVDVIGEMMNMINASRGYEANVMAISAAKQMILKALEI